MLMGYKVVVHNRNAGYVSCSSPLQVRYTIGEPTTRPPNCGPLAVFSNKKDAKHFIEYSTLGAHLFRCLYTPSKSSSVWYKGHSLIYTYALSPNKLPTGTIFADSVTLIEEVK
jgi:hypothetical protein